MSMETTDLPPGGFCGGEPHYRAARQRAAIACRKYNMLPEDCAPERRTNAWLEIVRPTIAKATRTMFDPNAVGAGPATSLATPPGTPRRSVDLSSGLSPSKMPVAEGKGKLSALDQLNPIDRLDSLPHSALPPTQITPSSSNDGLPESDAIYKLTSQRRHVNLYPGYGQAPYIKGPVYVDYGINLHIANSTFINRGCMILDTPHSEIRIGEKCSIGPGVHFYGVTHPLDPHHRMDPKYPASSIAADIRVGDMCWIGGGAKILGGVTIGEGAVIGAGSVVTKSVPPYTVAYGVPARIRRSIPRTPCRVDCKLDHQCVGSVSALDPRIPTRWHSVREFHRHWMRDNPGTIVAILLGMNSVSLAGVIWLSLRHIT